MIMNKKGVTILELLISISLISVILLLLLKVIISLEQINYDSSYASLDEIKRAEIIKEIESSWITNKLNGLKIIKEENITKILFSYSNNTEELIINDKTLTFHDTYTLESDKATYSRDIIYNYEELDDNYYYVSLIIPVLINNENTRVIDDISLSYIGLRNDLSAY